VPFGEYDVHIDEMDEMRVARVSVYRRVSVDETTSYR
jgi:hypothetical protein